MSDIDDSSSLNSSCIKHILGHFLLGEGENEERCYDVEMTTGSVEWMARSEIVRGSAENRRKMKEYEELHWDTLDDANTERRFVIEKILDRRWDDKTKSFEYNIQWTGYKEPTWEPEISLRCCEELKEKFEPTESVDDISSNDDMDIDETDVEETKISNESNGVNESNE
ncbi:hypothetical protein RFI_25063, partial [Reticulomyxa filosa]